MAKARGDTQTADLFGEGAYFPVRAPADLPRALDMKRGIATAMSTAVRQSGLTVPMIAAAMTEMLADDDVTAAQLYAYTSEARTSHTISIVRWVAFVRATRCDWLWDYILKHVGMIVLKGAEAHLAEATILEKQAAELRAKAAAHRAAAPVNTIFNRTRSRK
jgi:hypothetical protein